MRRTLFYLPVAFLAFGIGWLFVFKIYWKDLPTAVVEKTSIEINPTKQIVDDKMQSIKFSCNDEAINAVWEMLMRNKTFLNDAYINKK